MAHHVRSGTGSVRFLLMIANRLLFARPDRRPRTNGWNSLRDHPMRKMTMTSWLAVAVLATAGVAEAQMTRGGIVGTVRDSSGGLVPGATVSTTNTATNAARTAQTDTLGFFSIEALDPGVYDVVVELAGFTRVSARSVAVRTASDTSVDV